MRIHSVHIARTIRFPAVRARRARVALAGPRSPAAESRGEWACGVERLTVCAHRRLERSMSEVRVVSLCAIRSQMSNLLSGFCAGGCIQPSDRYPCEQRLKSWAKT